MTNEQIKEWQELYIQYKNGYHLSNTDKSDLIRLNHLMMGIANEIQNKNMLGEFDNE